MSDVSNLIRQLGLLDAGRVHYVPYNFKDDIRITVGTPPVPIVGRESISAGFLNTPTKLIKGLNASGVFVANRNLSGFIELVLMDGSISGGAIQAMEILGIPFPITAVDKQSGGTSRILGTKCRRVNTPTWRRAGRPGRLVYTFHTTRMLLFNGIRLAQSA